MSETAPDWRPHIRPASAADLSYIRATWLSSFRNSPWAGVVPNNTYDDVYGATIDQLTLRGMQLLVVANPAAPELLLGWLAFEVLPDRKHVVHYVFTKPTYRRLGVMSSLLVAAGVVGTFFYTFRTGNSRFLKGGVFRPEIARRKGS